MNRMGSLLWGAVMKTIRVRLRGGVTGPIIVPNGDGTSDLQEELDGEDAMLLVEAAKTGMPTLIQFEGALNGNKEVSAVIVRVSVLDEYGDHTHVRIGSPSQVRCHLRLVEPEKVE